MKILIVEDDPMTGMLILATLKKEDDFICDLVTSGGEGVRYAERELPDLVLMDHELPDGQGIDFLRQLRQIPGWSAKAVYMTAKAGDEAWFRDHEAEVHGIIAKPFDPSRLATNLRSIVAR